MALLNRLSPYLLIFFIVQFLLRGSLLARAWVDVDFGDSETVEIFLRGFWLDAVVAGFFMLPVIIYHMALPQRFHGSPRDRMVDKLFRFLFIFTLLFDAVAEHLFWSEFNTRFNFIAVDYLIYTQEVIGNIVESYPIAWIMLGIVMLAIMMTLASLRQFPFGVRPASWRWRVISGVLACAACVSLYSTSDYNQSQFGENAQANELAANGMYNLFYAFWHNEISYERFYATEPNKEVNERIQALLGEPELIRVNQDTQLVKKQGPELPMNVIVVAMESMSAAYMGAFGNDAKLTPNLDRLAKGGLLFTNLYATGTRTIRGLEALTLSVPPTPGQSLIRRSGNDNLFSLGFIFKDRGYDTRFIYGGYGYFDNMNNFFAANGFDVIDRTNMKKGEIQFANVWGVADEDLFARVIREADASYRQRKPFMHMVMTTSNHRPYTYPNGRIDVPSHSNRLGGVKYADYSIGKLIEWAREKPWFKDTVFVFVADHTAGAGGKAELDPAKYHIPMIFYAPELIKPQRFDHIASQIDMAPILLGQLNFSYYSKFYGEDLMHDDDEIPHAFISNYQKVALIKEGSLTVLSPKQGVVQYAWPDAATRQPVIDQSLVDDAVAYYQSASWWREHYKRIPTVVK